MQRTTLTVDKETKDRIASRGTADQTYDDVLRDILNELEKC